MLKMKLMNGTRIGISFTHDRQDEVSICKLFFMNADGEVDMLTDSCNGYAYCHSSDQFCKEKGRKISLSRAMDNAHFSRDERREIWNFYFAR